jgi:enediyne biosynthesis protein E4
LTDLLFHLPKKHMRHLLLSAFTLLSSFAFSQGDFVKQTDASNPINTFLNNGPYRGAAWIDLDNDGLIDFHGAPANLLRNTGNGQFVVIPNPMVTGAAGNAGPAGCSWSDYDNDGDIDCFIGARISRLYRNDGAGNMTADSAVFAVGGDYTGWSGSLGEINNDGRMDACIAYANGFHPGTIPTGCIFFKQNSAGILEQITGYAFTDSLAPYTVPYWSDYDLDGDMDLFIASGPAGTPGYDYCYKNLFIETGIDTLERNTADAFAATTQDGQCYNFIDYDNDADLDLCITNYNGASTRFYQNNSGIYMPLALPFTTTATKLANTWGDFDNDGDPDVIITGDGQTVKYYRNDGPMAFTAMTYDLTSKSGGSCASSCDYDNDGDLDLFIIGAGTAKGLFKNDSIAAGNHWVNITCHGTNANKSAIGTIVRIKATINGNLQTKVQSELSYVLKQRSTETTSGRCVRSMRRILLWDTMTCGYTSVPALQQ